MQAINEERDLTTDEIHHILKLQEAEIKRQITEDDGLTQEELDAENYSNYHMDYFKDRDKMRN